MGHLAARQGRISFRGVGRSASVVALLVSFLSACTDSSVGPNLTDEARSRAQQPSLGSNLAGEREWLVTHKAFLPSLANRGSKTVASQTVYKTRTVSGKGSITLPTPRWAEDLARKAEQSPGTAHYARALRLQQELRISEAARPATVLCRDVRPWERTLPLRGGGSVRLQGRGDSPSSRRSYYANGKLESTEDVEWVRSHSSWRMTRRVTRDASNTVVEEITIQAPTEPAALTLSPSASNATVARVDCEGPPAATVQGNKRFSARAPGAVTA